MKKRIFFNFFVSINTKKNKHVKLFGKKFFSGHLKRFIIYRNIPEICISDL